MSPAECTRVERPASDASVAGTRSSLAKRLVLVFACPGEVFEEIAESPPRVVNWLVPTALMIVVNLLVMGASSTPEVSTDWQQISVLTVLASAMAGTFWSALVLWGIGRVLLPGRFAYSKALEVVGLASTIAVLGSVETALLINACGEPTARPALSLFVRELAADNPVRLVLDQCNLFYFWSAVVLAIGLSRLSRVSFKQAGFWVFGYWVLARMGTVILGGA